ncbi:unnamed protein product [Discosporangium mesarthrocarpum]
MRRPRNFTWSTLKPEPLPPPSPPRNLTFDSIQKPVAVFSAESLANARPGPGAICRSQDNSRSRLSNLCEGCCSSTLDTFRPGPVSPSQARSSSEDVPSPLSTGKVVRPRSSRKAFRRLYTRGAKKYAGMPPTPGFTWNGEVSSSPSSSPSLSSVSPKSGSPGTFPEPSPKPDVGGTHKVQLDRVTAPSTPKQTLVASGVLTENAMPFKDYVSAWSGRHGNVFAPPNSSLRSLKDRDSSPPPGEEKASQGDGVALSTNAETTHVAPGLEQEFEDDRSRVRSDDGISENPPKFTCRLEGVLGKTSFVLPQGRFSLGSLSSSAGDLRAAGRPAARRVRGGG